MRKKILFVILCVVLLPLTAYAVRTTLTHTAVNVTATDASVLAANISRNFLHLYNDSDKIIYCKFGATAVLHAGIGIPASTSSVFENKVPTAALRCLHDGGAVDKVLLISEGTGP